MKDSTRVVSGESVEEALARADAGSKPTLLLATDGSPSAREAAIYAAGLAYRSCGIVVAIHITGGEAVEAGGGILEDAKAIVEEWCVRCDTVLADGEPARTIAQIAEKVEAACVLLGTGEGGSAEMAARVEAGCGIPVLAVRGDEDLRGMDRGQG